MLIGAVIPNSYAGRAAQPREGKKMGLGHPEGTSERRFVLRAGSAPYRDRVRIVTPHGRWVVGVHLAGGLRAPDRPLAERHQFLDLVHELALPLALLGDDLDDQCLAAAANEQVRVRVGGDAEGVERLLHLPSRLLAQRGVVVELPPRAWLARRDLELPRPERELPARSRLH